jgi:hypothetical protein
MPDPHDLEFEVAHFVPTLIEVLELHVRGHKTERDREIDRAHLAGEQILDVDVLLLRPDHCDRVLGIIEGRKEGEALDVIPVEMGQENVDGIRASFHEICAERPNS